MQGEVGLWVIQSKAIPKKVSASDSLRTESLVGHVDPAIEKRLKFNADVFGSIYGRAPTTGEIGCAFAHLKAYEHLLYSDLDSLLILEEDAEQVRNIENWPDLLRSAPRFTPWILRLENRQSKEVKRNYNYQVGLSDAWLPDKPGFGTTAYLISKTAAREILLDYKKYGFAFWQADWPPLAASRISFYSLNEVVFSHPIGESTIKGRPSGFAPSLARYVARVGRTLLFSQLNLNDRMLLIRQVHIRELRTALTKFQQRFTTEYKGL